MADNYVSGSFFLVIPSNKAERAMEVAKRVIEVIESDDDLYLGCEIQLTDKGIWFHEMEQFNPDTVATIASAVIDDLELDDVFVFSWSHSCSKVCEEIKLINMPPLYVIEFDDGDRDEQELFDAAKDEMPGILESFFEFCESGSREEKAAMYYLLEYKSMAWNDALEKIDEVQVSDLTLKQSAEEFFFDVYDVPKSIEIYIDIEKFANDCDVSGDFFEFEFAGCTYTVTNNTCF